MTCGRQMVGSSMLTDAKNDAKNDTRTEDFRVFESPGVSREILEKARLIVEVQNK